MHQERSPSGNSKEIPLPALAPVLPMSLQEVAERTHRAHLEKTAALTLTAAAVGAPRGIADVPPAL